MSSAVGQSVCEQMSSDGMDLRSRAQQPSGLLRVWNVIILFVVLSVGGTLALHGSVGSYSPLLIALVVFTWINIMITSWEIALHLRIDLIEKQTQQFEAHYRGRELDRVIDFFTAPLSLGDIFRWDTWAEVWSSYALFDDAYANRKSFGFWADTGNGFFTLLPCIFVVYGLAVQSFPAQVIGMVGLVAFWQMFYGTVIYFWAYIHSGQYRNHSKFNLALFIGGTNSLWMVFPLLGMYACVELIRSNSYAILN